MQVLEIYLIAPDWSEKYDSWPAVDFILKLMPKVIAVKSPNFELDKEQDNILIQQVAVQRIVFVEDLIGIDCRFPELPSKWKAPPPQWTHFFLETNS